MEHEKPSLEDDIPVPEDDIPVPEDEIPVPEVEIPVPEDEIPMPEEIPLPEEEENSEDQLTGEYDSVFDDISLEDDVSTDDDVILEVLEEVSEEEEVLPELDQPLLAAIQEEVEDPHKLAIEQIDLALAHLSNNSERLKVLEDHIDSLENDSDSSEDKNFELDQSTVNELKALIVRLEDELHNIQVQHLQTQINALHVSAAVSDKKLSENREQLALKERVLQDSSTLICSLSNALDNARNETTSVQASLKMFKRRCHKAERKSHADRKRVSSASARHEASLIEQQSLQDRVEELEAQINNMAAAQGETKELQVSEEVLAGNVNGQMSDSAKTTETVTPNESNLITRLALMERGYNEMLQYIMTLEIANERLRKNAVPNEVFQSQLTELENYKAATEEQINKQEIEMREVTYKLDGIEGILEIPMTPYIQANIAAAAALERSQQDFNSGQPMPMHPNDYRQIPVQSAPPSPQFSLRPNPKYALPPSPQFSLRPNPKYALPPSPKFAMPPVRPVIIHLDPNDKDSLDSDSASDEAQTGTQASTEEVQQPTMLVQEEANTSIEQVQPSPVQAQSVAESSPGQVENYGESSTTQTVVYAQSPILRQAASSPEQVQPNIPEPLPIPCPPMRIDHPTALFPPPGYLLPPFDQFCKYRPGSHGFLYKEVRDNRRCRWCWCALIPRHTVQCQLCKILVHDTCKKVVPFTCGYPDPIWNHYINLPVSHTEIPATQSYTMPNPCCWVIFHRGRSVRRFVMLYGPNINIYGHVPGPYDLPLEIIPLQMCGLMPRLTVDLTNRFKSPNVDKCIAYQQMVTPNPRRPRGATFILEFGNHWDRECFIDALSLFIATLTPPGPYDHCQNK